MPDQLDALKKPQTLLLNAAVKVNALESYEI